MKMSVLPCILAETEWWPLALHTRECQYISSQLTAKCYD